MESPLPALESRLRDLNEQMSNREELAAYAGGDALERMSAMLRRELRTDLMRIADRERLEVTAAIERVKAGTYGLCEECNERISAKRIAALPYARLCRDCQEKAELLAGSAGDEDLESDILSAA